MLNKEKLCIEAEHWKNTERDRQTSTDSYTFGLLAKQINTKKDIQTESIKVRKLKHLRFFKKLLTYRNVKNGQILLKMYFFSFMSKVVLCRTNICMVVLRS